MAVEHQGSRSSALRSAAGAAGCHSRGHSIRILGVLWTRDNSGRRISVPEMQSRSRVSARIRDPWCASGTGWTAGVLRRFRRNRGQAADSCRSSSEHPGRTRQLRRPGAHFVLSHRLVDAEVSKRLPVVLRCGARPACCLTTRMDSEALPSLRAAKNGEDVPARPVARLAQRSQPHGRAALLSTNAT